MFFKNRFGNIDFTLDQTLDVSTLTTITTFRGGFITPNGKQIVLIDTPADIWEIINLSVPFDLTTASFFGTRNLQESGPQGSYMSLDGTLGGSIGSVNHRFNYGTLSTPYDFNTWTKTDVIERIGGAIPKNAKFNADGTVVYTHSTINSSFYLIKSPLSTPYDLSTKGTDVNLTASFFATKDWEFLDDGKFIIYESDSTELSFVELSTPYDPTTFGNVISIHTIVASFNIQILGQLKYLFTYESDGNVNKYIITGKSNSSDTTAPSNIADLASFAVGLQTLIVDWTPPSYTNPIVDYEIYVDAVLDQTVSSPDIRATITDLTPSSSYDITVKVIDCFSNESGLSNQINITINASDEPLSNIISEYKFQDNVNDTVGLNNGTATDITYVTGLVGKTGVFNGTTSNVDCGNPANLQISSGTVTALIKTSDAGASFRNILSKRFAYNMFLIDNVFAIFDYNTSTTRSTGINLADNTWYHVAVFFDSGISNGTKLFIDGILKLTTTMTVTAQTENFFIGQHNSIQEFNGNIDSVRIWDRELTSAEILIIATEELLGIDIN